MSEPERVDAFETSERQARSEALLVCAYENDRQLETVRLDGGISFSSLRRELPSLRPEQQVIFYCA
jgi:hypothetical protein